MIELEKLKQEKESNQLKIENFDNASKSLDKLIGSQIPDKSRKGLGFVSYNVVPPPPTGLFSPPNLDLSNSGLEEFQQPEFEGYGPKTSKSVSEDTSNEVRESPDASLVEELVSNDKLEKKTVFPTVAKINFVRPQQQEKPVRKPVKYAEMYRSQTPRGNQRNWNNQKSQQLGSDFVMYNKACFVFNTAKGKFNTARPKAVNTAWPNTALVNAVRANQGHPQKEDQGYVNSGCSRHMTRNMSYLLDFKEFDDGNAFWNGIKAKIVDNIEQEITAIVDAKEFTITEASVRRHLQLADVDGISVLPATKIFYQLSLIGNMKRGFSGEHIPLYQSMLAIQAEEGEVSRHPSEPQPPPSTAQPTNEEPIPNGTSEPIPNVPDETVYEEWDDRVERATTTAASLDAE
ncbi:hypothetical protein Tco_1050579 [Tanacetum coccineum]